MLPVSGPAPASSPGRPAAESSGARHAALLLHAMAPADRAWVLDALPLVQREGLQALLAELEALGIERDPTLISEATAQPPEFVSPPLPEFDMGANQVAPMSDEAWLHTLDAPRLQELFRCMRAEPAGLVADWLSLADWPWAASLLAAMEPVQRRKVEEILSGSAGESKTPPGVRAVLISTVAAHLRGLAPAQVASPAPRRGLGDSMVRLLQNIRPRRSALR